MVSNRYMPTANKIVQRRARIAYQGGHCALQRTSPPIATPTDLPRPGIAQQRAVRPPLINDAANTGLKKIIATIKRDLPHHVSTAGTDRQGRALIA